MDNRVSTQIERRRWMSLENPLMRNSTKEMHDRLGRALPPNQERQKSCAYVLRSVVKKTVDQYWRDGKYFIFHTNLSLVPDNQRNIMYTNRLYAIFAKLTSLWFSHKNQSHFWLIDKITSSHQLLESLFLSRLTSRVLFIIALTPCHHI